MPLRAKISAGARFGRFTVLEEVGMVDNHLNVKCRCDCGREWIGRLANLTNGHIKSCGCVNREKLTERNRKHGFSKTPLYEVWKGMHARCYNPKHKSFGRYGGRGVTVCPEWHEYQPFHNWCMANGYRAGLQLDRENNNGIYCPDNCRFVTRKQNTNNTRRNIYIEYCGDTHTLPEWSEILGMEYSLIRSRYDEGYRGNDLFVPRKRRKAGDHNEAHI